MGVNYCNDKLMIARILRQEASKVSSVCDRSRVSGAVERKFYRRLSDPNFELKKCTIPRIVQLVERNAFAISRIGKLNQMETEMPFSSHPRKFYAENFYSKTDLNISSFLQKSFS